MRRLTLLFSVILLAGCIESQPPAFGGDGQRCAVDDDCTPGLQCQTGQCGPIDTCAAGIYVADVLPTRPDENGNFPINSLVRQVSGLANGVSVSEGELRVVNAGEPRLFEIDYFDDPDKNPELGLFFEIRMQLAERSNECTAVLSLWPTKTDRIKLCFGGGRIGIARPGGGSTGLVAAVPDLTQSHVYRIDFSPVEAGVDRNIIDAGFVVTLSIDGEIAATGLTLSDFPEPESSSDRAPLIGFGAQAAGTVSFDYVRWGCDPNGGPCPVGELDDDQCDTERQNAGACGGNAVANELCDNRDNDCDGQVDENYTRNFPDGRPIAFGDFGEEVFKGENCGLIGACEPAIVVCDAAKTGLTCDVSAFEQQETCDGHDNDCDGMIDEDFGPASSVRDALYVDPITNERIPLGAACGVGECAGGTVTCENLRPSCSTEVNRQVSEVCGNRRDDDCDGSTDEGFDVDGDGFQACLRCTNEVCVAGAHDCNDTMGDGADINPGAEEVCNQIDDNCNDQVDEGLDLDGDGFLPCGPVSDCRDDPSFDVEGFPSAYETSPGADEACTGTDLDCDGRIDEGFSQLQPNGSMLYTSRAHCGQCGNDCAVASDSYNTTASCTERPGGGFGCSTTCRPGFVDADGDVAVAEQFWNIQVGDDNKGCECQVRADTICDSGNVNRACAEICNGIDDDCDGQIDEAADMDLPGCWDAGPLQREVGICRDGVRRCIDGRLSDQCFGSTLPEAGQERFCDNRDEDCDGRVDEGERLTDPSGQVRTGDACATGLDGNCAAGVQACVNGDVACVPREGLPEVCNGIGDDCDDRIDEDFVRVDASGHPVNLAGGRVFDVADFIYNQLAHCGACGAVCARPNGLTDCSRGACTFIGCEPGFLDEDGNPENGCEAEEPR